MSVTSDEVNYLIYRYLQESGFSHASFTFGHESHILKNEFKNVKVAPGALIALLQKGLLYAEAEAHINEDGTERDCSRPFSLLQPHECEKSSGKRNKKEDYSLGNSRRDQKNKEENRKKQKKPPKEEDKMEVDINESEINKKSLAREVVSSTDVLVLTGHQSEVFNCEWNSQKSLLATGSGDGTARIWRIPETVSINSKTTYDAPIILKHEDDGQEQKDVTAVTWNPQGTLLATGAYSGVARVWSDDGQLQQTLTKHKGPIFSLKWNKNGSLLLSGGVDKTVVAWDAGQPEPKQVFEDHTAPVLEVDWMNDDTFASCSTDKTINVSRLGERRPLRRFEGHTHEVNAIKWCPRGILLASCSDDKTAKIWKLDSDSYLADFREHEKEIYTISWSPTGPGTDNPNLPLLLATASFDHTIKLWDPETGKCVSDLSKYHSQAVYSIAFSPDGRYLASGSFDSRVNLWNVRDGSLIRTFKGTAGVFDLSWNSAGDRIAASLANNTVCLFDFRQLI